MKLFTVALGAGIGIGYLAANEDARNKAWASLKQAKESSQAKSIRDEVSGAVSQLSDKRRAAQDSTDVWDDPTHATGDGTAARPLMSPIAP